MAGSSEKLGRKKKEAIIALLSHRSIEDAAKACSTPARTIYRWLNEADFDAAATRVRAAENVLAHAAKAIEIEDIDARLRELEAAADQHTNGGRK